MKRALNPKTGIHSFELRHGDLIGMRGKYFQKRAKHRVPPFPKSRGWRMNLTIRKNASPPWAAPVAQVDTVNLGEECFVDCNHVTVPPELKQELLEAIRLHGAPDITTVHGNVSTNKGRTILELANTAGRTYQYGRKETPPGQAFGPHTRAFILEHVLGMFGPEVGLDQMWAHLVFYPTPDCALSWHGDSEDNIDSQLIVSLTILEDPVLGPRPFDVRLNSEVEARKKKKQKKA